MTPLVETGSPSGTRAVVATLLVLTTLATFAPVLVASFTSFDDEAYVTENPHVKDGLSAASLRWALTATDAANWHPVTWWSHMLDWELFGGNPGGHHLSSLLLHAINAVTLFLLLDSLTGSWGRSAVVAALFALHPLHVESVAWVAERKDLLSTLFWLLGIGAYVRWVRAPGWGRYTAVLVCHALALAAKPMPVTLPVTLLLLDVWPLERWRRAEPRSSVGAALRGLVLEKAPLIALSAASSVVTVLVQRKGGALVALDVRPLADRLANAVVACAEYLVDTVWPAGLAAFYPIPAAGQPLWKILGAGAALGLISFVVWQRRSHPWLAVGWLWYVVTLLPVIGLVQVGQQARADRYTYVPLIGIFLMACWEIPATVARRFVGAIVIMLGALAAATFVQAGYWRDTRSLAEHALEVTDGNPMAHLQLSGVFEAAGDLESALAHCSEAVRLAPGVAEAREYFGRLLAERGRGDEAIREYRAALAIDPRLRAAHNNLGNELARRGQIEPAIEHYEEALRIDPGYTQAHTNLGVVLTASGRAEAALRHFETALKLAPDSVAALYGSGAALAALHRWEEAAARFTAALRLEPGHAKARAGLAVALAKTGRGDEALREAKRPVP